MSRAIGRRSAVTALLLSVLVGCGSSVGGSQSSATTDQSPTCTTAAATTTTTVSTTASSVALAGKRVVLAPDGLGPAKFGQPSDTVISLLTDALGPPLGRPLVESGVSWGAEDATHLTAFFSVPEAGGVSHFTGWQLSGDGPLDGVELASPDGITLGTSVADLLAAHPDAVVGADWLPQCGDSWWLPNQFEFGEGLRGIAGPLPDQPDVVLDMAEAALAAHGHPIDWGNCGDPGCWAEVADYQRSVGLPDSGLFDRATWLALGLPLPADPTAVIHYLEAGTGIVYC